MAEFALILPIILIILLGMVNVALAIRAQIQLAQVAQQAVQYLVHHPDYGYPTDSNLVAYMNTLSSYQFDTSATQNEVSVTPSPLTITVDGQPFTVLQDTVTIDYPFVLLFPMIGSLSVGGLNLGSIHLGARASSIVATDPPRDICVQNDDAPTYASCPDPPAHG
ncbi:MAG TPA: TadE/TadG family type IV pilus assembly protein, partial [Chloroflexota bacterium]|nr:TadE/TadG family type IV pilus assembly protein [Chloroflexota bacterium]